MADNEEIVAEHVETPEVVVEEAPKRAIPADEGIEGLKKQLEAEKSRREELEKRARAAEVEVHKAKAETDETNLQLLTNAVETVKAKTEALESALANAINSGDGATAAKLQRELAKSEAQLLQLENGRQAMMERPKTPPPPLDPVESLASQLTPRSAAWVRVHPEYARDPRKTQAMVAAHNLAIAKGVEPDTDDYFETVERHLDMKPVSKREEAAEPDDEGTELAAKVVSRRSSPAAAPVSRSAPSSDGTKPRVIRLTAEEQEVARLTKQTYEEYHRNKYRERYN